MRNGEWKTEMTVEQNLRMVDAAFEAINERNWDHLWGLHVDNIVMSSPDLPEPVKGREAVQERLQAWGEALPDLSWTRVRGFGQGDWVCVELLITGTHKGPLRHGFDRRCLGRRVTASSRQPRIESSFEGALCTKWKEARFRRATSTTTNSNS